MNRVTSGVTIPSFRPLSTFSARRMRTGTRGLLKIGSPRAASVGARTEQSGQRKSLAWQHRERHQSTQADGEQETNRQQPQRDRGVVRT